MSLLKKYKEIKRCDNVNKCQPNMQKTTIKCQPNIQRITIKWIMHPVCQIVAIQFAKDQKNLQASGLYRKTAISYICSFLERILQNVWNKSQSQDSFWRIVIK